MDSHYSIGRRVRAWSLVTAQLALLAAGLLPRHRRNWSTKGTVRATAVGVTALGLGFAAAASLSLGRALTASPLPVEHSTLHRTGPYAITRHPIYTGLLLADAAHSATSGDRRQLARWALLAGVLRYKTAFEEQALTERFPGYTEYTRQTPRLIPSLSRGRPDRFPTSRANRRGNGSQMGR